MNFNIMCLARNEEKILPLWLKGIKNQTLMPNKIIILDDGSTDKTPEILSELKKPFFVIRYERKDSFHFYGRVLKEASKYLDDNCDFIGILDVDTYLEPKYYEKIIPKITEKNGMCCGVIYGEEISKRVYGLDMYYVYGANRVYIRKCWYNLNNGNKILKDTYYGLDTYHYLKALKLGYIPELFIDIESWSLRKRLRTSSQMMIRGLNSYRLGYYSWFMILRMLKNKSPIMLAGYLKGLCANSKKWKTINYIRETQIQRIKQILGLKVKKRSIKEIIEILTNSIMYQRNVSRTPDRPFYFKIKKEERN